MLITSQGTKEGDMGIYKREFLGIMREVQLGITVRTLMTTLPVEVAMPYPHFHFLILIFFLIDWNFSHSTHLVIKGKFRLVILLWIPSILVLITVRESVIPSYVYPGFLSSYLSSLFAPELLTVN